MKPVPPKLIGLDGCTAPFAGTVLLGVRQEGGSVWFALEFAAAGAPLKSVSSARSDDLSFPDADFVEQRRPVLVALADEDDWKSLGDPGEFQRRIVNGRFELGGNFARFRQHLEWLVAQAPRLRITDALGTA